MSVASNMDLYITLYLFVLFGIYGFTNIYLLVYLRKKSGYIVSFEDFIRLYLGNIKNYFFLNRRFLECVEDSNRDSIFNKLVAFAHKASLVLVLANFPLFMALAFWL